MGILYLVAITNGSLSIIVAGPTFRDKNHSKAIYEFKLVNRLVVGKDDDEANALVGKNYDESIES